MGLWSSEGVLTFALPFLPFFVSCRYIFSLSIFLAADDEFRPRLWPRCYVDYDWKTFGVQAETNCLIFSSGERFSKRWLRLVPYVFRFFSIHQFGYHSFRDFETPDDCGYYCLLPFLYTC